MTDLATLVVKLDAETAAYSAKLDAANKKLASFQDDIVSSAKEIGTKLIEAFAVEQFIEFTNRVIESEAHLAELAKQTGIATDELSKLQFAAKLEGVDDLSTALAKLSVSSQQAAAGNKQLLGTFNAIGISVEDLRNLTPDQLLLKVADGFAKYADGAAKVTVARELLGRGGAQLVAFFDQGSAAISAQGQELQKLGGVITPEASAAAKEYEDNLIRLKAAFTGIIDQSLIVIVPLLKSFTDEALDTAKSTNTLSDSVQTLVTSFKLIVTGATTIVTAFEVVGKGIGGVAAVVSSAIDKMSVSSSQLAAGPFTAIATNFAIALAKSGAAATAATDDIAETVGGAATKVSDLWGGALSEIEITAKKIPPIKPQIELPNTEALQAIISAIAGLKQKAADIDLSSGAKATNLSAAQAAISVGNLADKVREGGAAAKPFVQAYLDAAVALDRVQALAGVTKLNDNIEQQINTFQKGKVAVVEYTLTQGTLGAQLKELAGRYPEITKLINNLISNTAVAEVQSYQDTIKNIDIQLLTLQGHTAEAAEAQFDLANKMLVVQGLETKDSGGQELLDKIAKQKEYNKTIAETAEIQTNINNIRSSEAAQEEVINAAIASGQKTQIDGDAQISDLRKAELAQLDELVAKYNLIAETSGKNIPQIQLQAQQLNASLKTLDSSTDLLAKKLRTDFINSASDAFTSFVTGSQTASQAIHSFLTSIESELIKLATNKVLESLFSTGDSGGGGGIFSALAGLFGGGGSTGVTFTGTSPDITPIFEASGGSAKAGQKLEVGELGPEEFVPDTNGKIVPNSQMGKKGDTNIYFTVQAPNGTVNRATQQQIAASTQMGISRASRRNN